MFTLMSTRGSLFIPKAITQIYARSEIWFFCSKGSKGNQKGKEVLLIQLEELTYLAELNFAEKELARLQKGNTLAEIKILITFAEMEILDYACWNGNSNLRLLKQKSNYAC